MLSPPTLERILQGKADLSIFSDLIERAGLRSDSFGLGNSSVFTILVPNDDAFRGAFDEETLDYLADPANKEDLLFLISYHLMDGVYPSSSLNDGDTFYSLGGLGIDVAKSDDALFFNGAGVTTADIVFGKGICHVIDRVLGTPPTQPPVTEQQPLAAADSASAASLRIASNMLVAVLGMVLSLAFR